MSTPPDLPAFVLARIAEDEAAANAAMPGPWFATENDLWASPIVCENHWPGLSVEDAVAVGERPGPPHYVVAQTKQGGRSNVADAAHIARHDPARVLADCAAKRAIVEQYRAAVEDDDTCTDPERGWVTDGVRMALKRVVRVLAQAHADHADFRPEWRLAE